MSSVRPKYEAVMEIEEAKPPSSHDLFKLSAADDCHAMAIAFPLDHR
jgi:hypothetical protein